MGLRECSGVILFCFPLFVIFIIIISSIATAAARSIFIFTFWFWELLLRQQLHMKHVFEQEKGFCQTQEVGITQMDGNVGYQSDPISA